MIAAYTPEDPDARKPPSRHATPPSFASMKFDGPGGLVWQTLRDAVEFFISVCGSCSLLRGLLVLLALLPSAAYAAETMSVGDFEYVAILDGSITIMDVTIPNLPLTASHIPGNWNDFTIHNNRHIVAHDGENIHVVDVTDPYRPVTVSVLSGQPDGLLGTVTLDGVSYVALAIDYGVRLIDITEPGMPHVHSYNGYGSILRNLGQVRVMDVESHGSLMLVTTPDAVQIRDYGEPGSPVMSNILPGRFGFGDVGPLTDAEIIHDDDTAHALLAGQRGIISADLSNPSHPVQSSMTGGFDGITDLDILGGHAAVMHGEQISILDVSDPGSPVLMYDTDIISGLDELATATPGDGMWILAVGEAILALDITDPSRITPGYASVAQDLYAPMLVETAIINDRLYALVGSDVDDSVQIFDLTDPYDITPVSTGRIAGNQHAYGLFYGISGMSVAEIDGMTYAVVVSAGSNAVSILDITDPRTPLLVSVIRDTILFAPTYVDTYTLDGSTYAAVSRYYGGGIQLIDISDPHAPEPVTFIPDDQYGFDGLFGPLGLDTYTLDGSSYAVVGSYFDNAVQIIDVTDPLWPVATASVFADDTHAIRSPHDVGTARIGDGAFAVVTSVVDDTLSVFDVSDPSAPTLASRLTDGEDGIDGLSSVKDLDILQTDDATYALTTSYFDGSVNILDITDPYMPVLDSAIFFDVLGGPRQVSAVAYGDGMYAVVVDYAEDSVHVIDITDTKNPIVASSIIAGFNSVVSLIGPQGVDSATISDRTYTLSAVYSEDAVRITDITDPGFPVHVHTMLDGQDGFVMDGPIGVDITTVSDRTMAVILGYWSYTMQVVDVSEPASPVPVATFRAGENGFVMDGVVDVDTVELDGVTYAVVASGLANAIQIIDITDTSGPVATIRSGEDGFDLGLPEGMNVIRMHDRVYLAVSSFFGGNVQIIDITDPTDPRPVSVIQAGGEGYEMMDYPVDLDSIQVGDQTILVVGSYQRNSITMIDITDPYNPYPVSIAAGSDGFFLREVESVSAVDTGSGVFVAVSSNADSVQLVDITDPANPIRAGPTGGTRLGFTTYGVTDTNIIQFGGGTYMVSLTRDENVSPIVDITNPYSPVTVAIIPPVPVTFVHPGSE